MAAPKENKFALGHGFGRPPKYETVAEFIAAAKDYFALVTTTTGICKPTKSGLVFHLGFNTHKSFYDYKMKGDDKNGDNWKYNIERIERFIESCYETNLHGYNWGGSAYALKNLFSDQWKDEITQNQIITNVSANFGTPISTTHESAQDSSGDKQPE